MSLDKEYKLTPTMYKVAEKFLSIQGEGYWAGTPMAFVRLSQCPVGGPNGICRAWNGQEFKCDTGKLYHHDHYGKSNVEHHSYNEVNETLSAEEIIEWGRQRKHLCITGGEPLIYDLEPLLLHGEYTLHVETSGTVQPSAWMKRQWNYLFSREGSWMTVSPKFGWYRKWLEFADEWKILVTKDTTFEQMFDLIQPFYRFSDRAYFQPIEDEHWEANVIRAVQMAEKFGGKLGLQMHKYIGLR